MITTKQFYFRQLVLHELCHTEIPNIIGFVEIIFINAYDLTNKSRSLDIRNIKY